MIENYLTDCYIAIGIFTYGPSGPHPVGIWHNDASGAPRILLWRDDLPYNDYGAEMWTRLTTGLADRGEIDA